MDRCDIDPDDKHFPYAAATFAVIGRLRKRILEVSAKLRVPPVAVAGAIADEYNIMATDWGGHRWRFDRVIDWGVHNLAYEFMFDWSVRVGSRSKLANLTRQDIGNGNINVATARTVYDEFRGCFLDDFDDVPTSASFVDDSVDMREFVDDERAKWGELVDFMLTDEGTVVIAALVIKKAQEDLAPYLQGRSAEIREALLVTYYKQGPDKFLGRFHGRLAANPSATLVPGEGCRVYQQRDAFLNALGLPPADRTALPDAPACW